MDLREVQRPLRQRYRADPSTALLTLRASAREQDSPMACSVDIGRAVYEAQAHSGVGGPGTAACSGDLLLGALVACAQVTYQLMATAMGVPVASVQATVEGDLDLRGTLGVDPGAPVGFTALPPPVRGRRTRRHRRAAGLGAGEDRALLRGPADPHRPTAGHRREVAAVVRAGA